MTTRRAVLAALALAGCGGGGAPALPVVAVYGDSIASGQIATEPGEPLRYLAVRPAQRLQQLLEGRAVVLDRAEAGATAAGSLAGFPARLAADQPDVAVLRFGGADAVLGTHPAAFSLDLALLVNAAKLQGRRVVVVGLPHHPAHEDALAALDSAARGIADWARAPFADTFAAPAGALADGIHPDQVYSDQMTAVIDAALPLPHSP
jgi:hypothetical protein